MTTERIVPGTPSWRSSWVDHYQRYEFFAPRCVGSRVLDVACGSGYGSDLLGQAGAAFTVGADRAPEAISFARSHYRRPGIVFTVADATDLPFPAASFDVVLSFETIEHLLCPERLVNEVARILRPSGLFVCSTPNIKRHSRAGLANEFHLRELDLEEFHQLVGERFSVEELWYQAESPAYRRHAELVKVVRRQYAAIATSLGARIERRLRRVIGRPRPLPAPPDELLAFVPGDFVIEAASAGAPEPKTYIIVGTRRSD